MKKRKLLLLNLRFSGFLEPFGCGLHNNKLFLIDILAKKNYNVLVH